MRSIRISEKHGKICNEMKTELKYSMLALIWFQTNFGKLLKSHHYNFYHLLHVDNFL